MIKAVIFDHDGVIADTEPIHFRADNAVLARYGFSISSEANDLLVGLSTKKSWEMFKDMFTLPEAVDYLVTEKTATVVSLISKEGIAASQGLLELLRDLRQHEYQLAIASGQYRRVIDAVIQRLGIAKYFRTIVSCEDTAHGKPNPEVFLTTARQLGLSPAECLVIEDSASGVAAAKAAGMPCIALRTPSTASHDVSKADTAVDSLTALSSSIIRATFG